MTNDEIYDELKEIVHHKLMILGVDCGTWDSWEEVDPPDVMWADIELNANGHDVFGHIGRFSYLCLKVEAGQFQLGIEGDNEKYHEGVLNFLAINSLR